MLAYLLQIVVTVHVMGQAPITERLHAIYPNNNGACERRADDIMAHAIKRKGTTITVECQSTQRRNA